MLRGVLLAGCCFLDRFRPGGAFLSGCLDRPKTLDSRLKLLGDPAVQALAGHGRSHIHLTVKLRGHPRHELAGKWLIGSLATLQTKGQVIID